MVVSINRTDLLHLLEDDGVQLVDVLPEAEYERSHIPGALNVPLKTLDAGSTQHLDRAKPVVVY